ncbi:mavicyanin-like [Phragmites australis]|uniref:mavicyanin-like n=1 Tax=Phragmites australis TaxID=29695 RepID=UPI002D765FBD|nr:mavicyanin-like [Phragmites australis]
MAQARFALALCVLLVHGVAPRADAVSYNVGNSAGWDLSADFPSWVDGKTFYVGDVLVFQYSKYHTLNEVDEAGFKNCSAANPLLSRSDGNSTVPLTAPGDRYFICGNQLHCLGGMKLHVLASLPPAPAAAPAGGPQSTPQADPGTALGPSTDDSGIPRLVLGGSHRITVGPLLVTWLCVVAALLV